MQQIGSERYSADSYCNRRHSIPCLQPDLSVAWLFASDSSKRGSIVPLLFWLLLYAPSCPLCMLFRKVELRSSPIKDVHLHAPFGRTRFKAWPQAQHNGAKQHVSHCGQTFCPVEGSFGPFGLKLAKGVRICSRGLSTLGAKKFKKLKNKQQSIWTRFLLCFALFGPPKPRAPTPVARPENTKLDVWLSFLPCIVCLLLFSFAFQLSCWCSCVVMIWVVSRSKRKTILFVRLFVCLA